MIEALPEHWTRVAALDRIRSLDCANLDASLASCDPSRPPTAEAAVWRKSLEDARVDDEIYASALTAELKTLVCSGGDHAVYVLRGMIDNLPSRLAAAGPEAPALIDVIMNKDSKACPVSTSLTDADNSSLLLIKQTAPENGMVHELVP